MKLNSISPGPGSKKPRLRVGRGASAGQGKTCGRGVKGQRARKGGYHKVGFEVLCSCTTLRRTLVGTS